MTGYAVVTHETIAGILTIELKSVNSRFLDLSFRMNDDLRMLEAGLRESIMSGITRGKVECRVSFGRKHNVGALPSINFGMLDAVAQLQIQVQQKLAHATPLSVHDILRWPGMVEEAQLGQESIQNALAETMRQAITVFVESRTREGAALQAMLESRITQLETIVTQITPLIPKVVAQFQQKATERMHTALGFNASGPTVKPPSFNTPLSREDVLDRIRQEVTLYGIRIDVAEELNRLSTHLAETRHVLNKGGPVGKRLDFMMQELNREANTIGSKAAAKELADASMAMKLLIEQMREQIQNLE
jgi:uncharacterized protein YicC (UPF0701 family)